MPTYVAEDAAARHPDAGAVVILRHQSRRSVTLSLSNHLHLIAERRPAKRKNASAMYHAAGDLFIASIAAPWEDTPEVHIGTRIYRLRKED